MTRNPGLGKPIELGASGVEKRLAAFRRHWPLHGDRLLDVGCGNGAYTEAMAPAFARVDAVDVEPGRIQEFRGRLAGSSLAGRIHVHEMAAEGLDFPDGTFDVVTAIEVLEHVRSLEATLAEVRRVLRPSGAFLVTCPNRLFPVETHMVRALGREFPGRYLPFLPYAPRLHARMADARTFTARSLRALAVRHGLQVVAIDHVMPPFDGWRGGRRWVRPVTDRLERSRLGVFGVSVVGVFTPR
jgi:ubiquinone/menaquinone biosynthesis C-methylase UbiE